MKSVAEIVKESVSRNPVTKTRYVHYCDRCDEEIPKGSRSVVYIANNSLRFCWECETGKKNK